jgi:hypothetical protein
LGRQNKMSVLLDIITRLGGRIEGGSPYGWDCFGPNARLIDFPNVGVVFDGVTQEVYSIDAWPEDADSEHESIFWVAPGYEVAHNQEAKSRNVEITAEQCYSFESMMTIAVAVMDGLSFDEGLTRDVDLHFDEDELVKLMAVAKSLDMTLDEFVNMALKEKLDAVKSEKKKKKRAK